MRIVPAAAALATLGVLLAGCSAAPDPAEAFLAQHGLAGLTTAQVIDKLDASEDDRKAGPFGSVRPDEVQLSDATGAKVSLPVTDRFYLSVAPYLTQTHECFNHNLASCKGELANQVVHVTVTDAAGATVVDADVTTFANGFAGLWLPRGITGTITTTYQGKTASQAIGTGAGDPTCLTTLRLQ